MKKILHLAPDSIFINFALESFESEYPNQNTVWIFDSNHKVKTFDYVGYELISSLDRFNPIIINRLSDFDLVIVHAFQPAWYPILALSPSKVKFAWLGWGFDYYDYIYEDKKRMYLDKTRELYSKCCISNDFKLKELWKVPVRWFINTKLKQLAFKKISSISPVIPDEYELIRGAGLIPRLPHLIPWNYANLEFNLLKGYGNAHVSGHNILLGNSATYTNNHIEAIDLIKECLIDMDNTLVVTPLSYGDDECCKKNVVDYGTKSLNSSFTPLLEFMSMEEYVAIIKKCGFVIMNHVRQQAVGNIVIMLYLGARVFLREENPVYKMLKNEGAVINSVQELQANPYLLKTPLMDEEILFNKNILYKHWSKRSIDLKTKNLVEFHLGEKS